MSVRAELPAALETARLSLRRVRVEDAAAVLARWASDPDATRYMLFPTYAADDVSGVEAFLATCVRNWEEGFGHRPWAMCLRPSEASPIGLVGVTRLATHAWEVGYILGRRWWGQGYVTEAVRGVVAHLFADPAVWRVMAPTHIDNTASQRVLAKSGFSREATLRRYLVFPNLGKEPQDCSLWAMTRDDLESG